MTFPLRQSLPTVSRLVYGCMHLGGSWDQSPISSVARHKAFAALETALEQGINCFDHADIYTHGKSEQVFGDFLRQHQLDRQQLVLQSKCGIRFADGQHVGRYDFSADYIRSSVEASLRRLQTDYLDLLLLHRPDPLMQPEMVADVFHRLQQEGKVRAFGVSNMAWPQLQLLQRSVAEPLQVNQLQMSLADHHWVEEGVLTGMPSGANVHFAAGTVEFCQLHAIQLQAWGSLAQGLYSGGRAPETAAEQATAEVVQQLAADYQISAEAIVLAWLLRHPAAIQPVIGTLSPERIKACPQALAVELSREHWYQLYVAARGQALP
ncbi:aldo/keto reductase [Alkalimonas collagenimarina]|uniref:Aldo/keto reductase n=1 Tax=Alkalimonas collagenimarina TaxID=400390 RepID=A0ABT9H0G4_9GAMM|nr:aldo/keto reductase [Alkalimonas collagenimarina]MDP4536693.1 aldo/keto reductase [Alkalimonas collagenimarina]